MFCEIFACMYIGATFPPLRRVTSVANYCVHVCIVCMVPGLRRTGALKGVRGAACCHPGGLPGNR